MVFNDEKQRARPPAKWIRTPINWTELWGAPASDLEPACTSTWKMCFSWNWPRDARGELSAPGGTSKELVLPLNFPLMFQRVKPLLPKPTWNEQKSLSSWARRISLNCPVLVFKAFINDAWAVSETWSCSRCLGVGGGGDSGGTKLAVRVIMPYKSPNSRRGVLETVLSEIGLERRNQRGIS